jgi:hypothetical protein
MTIIAIFFDVVVSIVSIVYITAEKFEIFGQAGGARYFMSLWTDCPSFLKPLVEFCAIVCGYIFFDKRDFGYYGRTENMIFFYLTLASTLVVTVLNLLFMKHSSVE